MTYHPGTIRPQEGKTLAAAACWTSDPITAELVSILRALSKAGTRLHALGSGDHEISSVASEVGEVASIYERSPTTEYAYDYRTRANGGACACLWEALDSRRRAHMEKTIHSEGMSPGSDDGFLRWMEIDAETPSVADAWSMSASAEHLFDLDGSGV